MRPFKRAIVIGASMGGIMVARALSDSFDEVIVLDRDPISPNPNARKGVPQGRHIHVLLHSGQEIVSKFFPGMLEELSKKKDGIQVIDSANDFAWHHFGVWKTRFKSDIRLVLCTRPFLEFNAVKRLRKIQGVKIMGNSPVATLIYNRETTRVTGVSLESGKSLLADLIVDATGRSSRTPQWLEEFGFKKPTEETVGIDLAYTSRLYKPPKKSSNQWRLLIQYPRSPVNWKAGFISTVEGGRWVVSLNGYFKDHAPIDDKGFLEFAKSLPRPDIYENLKKAKVDSPLSIHKIPTNRWRRYDRLSSFPKRLLVVADGVCAFNPIFGQGMSVASLEANLISELLKTTAQESNPSLDDFSNAARKKLPKAIWLPWFLTKNLDLHYPMAKGSRMPGHSILMWYITSLLELTSVNKEAYESLLWVIHLKRGLWSILRPAILLKVIGYGISRFFIPLEKRANVDKIPA